MAENYPKLMRIHLKRRRLFKPSIYDLPWFRGMVGRSYKVHGLLQRAEVLFIGGDRTTDVHGNTKVASGVLARL